MSFYVTG